MIRRPPRSTPLYSSAASDVYKRQHLRAHRPMLRALADHVANRLVVREPQHVLEVARRVFGVAARVGTTEHRDRAARAEEGADRVGQLRGLGERANEQHVDVLWQDLGKSFRAGVADIVAVSYTHLRAHETGRN